MNGVPFLKKSFTFLTGDGPLCPDTAVTLSSLTPSLNSAISLLLDNLKNWFSILILSLLSNAPPGLINSCEIVSIEVNFGIKPNLVAVRDSEK